MASFTFRVTWDVERLEGLHASKDSVRERLLDALEACEPDLDGLGPREDSAFEIVDTTIEEVL